MREHMETYNQMRMDQELCDDFHRLDELEHFEPKLEHQRLMELMIGGQVICWSINHFH